MDFSSIPLFSIMKTKLDYLSQRQSVLAQNMANADTPGYKAQDIQAPDFAKLLSQDGSPSSNLRMAVTSPGHIIPNNAISGDFKLFNRPDTSELNPNGNNVSIEDESAKMAMNQMDYQKVLNLYSKAISMFKTAIGNPSTGS